MKTFRHSSTLSVPCPVLESQKTEHFTEVEKVHRMSINEGQFHMKVEITKKIQESPKPMAKRPMSAGTNRLNLMMNTSFTEMNQTFTSNNYNPKPLPIKCKYFLSKEPKKASYNITKKAREFRRKYPGNWKPLTFSTAKAKLKKFMVRGISPMNRGGNLTSSLSRRSSVGTTT